MATGGRVWAGDGFSTPRFLLRFVDVDASLTALVLLGPVLISSELLPLPVPDFISLTDFVYIEAKRKY
jgi:hypothetical protein